MTKQGKYTLEFTYNKEVYDKANLRDDCTTMVTHLFYHPSKENTRLIINKLIKEFNLGSYSIYKGLV